MERESRLQLAAMIERAVEQEEATPIILSFYTRQDALDQRREARVYTRVYIYLRRMTDRHGITWAEYEQIVALCRVQASGLRWRTEALYKPGVGRASVPASV